MHEMGITSGILASVVEAAEAEGATRINEVDISIGDLTEIVEDALQFAWEALTPGTMAEGSTLVVTHVPGHVALHPVRRRVRARQVRPDCARSATAS